MNYTENIHSSIVNPTAPATQTEADSVDTVTMDVPLLTRLLEFSREDIKSDQDLHIMITNILNLKNEPVLTMDQYEQIIKIDNTDAEIESIQRLAGL